MADQALAAWIAENHDPFSNFPKSLQDAFTQLYTGGKTTLDFSGMNIKSAQVVERDGKKAVVYAADFELIESNQWTHKKIGRTMSGHFVVTGEWVIEDGHEFRWV